MKVKCITDTARAEDTPFPNTGRDAIYHLEPGQDYVVYGVGLHNDVPVYAIVYQGMGYPMFIPACCFGEVKGTLPEGMLPSYDVTPVLKSYLVSAPAFAKDHFFYDSLTDGDPKAEAIWQEFKNKVDRASDE